jgi:hypothetical protein
MEFLAQQLVTHPDHGTCAPHHDLADPVEQPDSDLPERGRQPVPGPPIGGLQIPDKVKQTDFDRMKIEGQTVSCLSFGGPKCTMWARSPRGPRQDPQPKLKRSSSFISENPTHHEFQSQKTSCMWLGADCLVGSDIV